MLPSILVGCLIVLYYYLRTDYDPSILTGIVIYPLLDVALSMFVFGMLVFGFLGMFFAILFFKIHAFFSRNKKLETRYVRIRTGYEVTGKEIIGRAFLLYCIAISLTLTTMQIAGFLDFFPDPDTVGLVLYLSIFEPTYTNLVFFYSFCISFILAPIWYFDDLNVMYFSVYEDVTFLRPFGMRVLPALKGFGSFSIIISYLIFIINQVGFITVNVPFYLLLDPLLTLFIPILFLIGFELVSFVGKKYLKKWLIKKGIEEYDDLEIVLTRKNVETNDSENAKVAL